MALHDGLLAEAQQLREARVRALAGAHDTSMVGGAAEWGQRDACICLAGGIRPHGARSTSLQAAIAAAANSNMFTQHEQSPPTIVMCRLRLAFRKPCLASQRLSPH